MTDIFTEGREDIAHDTRHFQYQYERHSTSRISFWGFSLSLEASDALADWL
jgi:hypothetical protein